MNGIDATLFPRENRVGRNGDPVLQDGDNNDISILQGGIGSRVGTSDQGDGVEQTGDRNALDIEQIGLSNRVNQVIQSGTVGAATLQNEAIIIQTDANDSVDGAGENVITSIRQTNSGGAANAVLVDQLGDRNFVGPRGPAAFLGQAGGGEDSALGGVLQQGTGNDAIIVQDGIANRLNGLSQNGTGNAAAVLQFGRGNLVDSVLQQGGTGAADGNEAGLLIVGDDNGTAAFAGGSFADATAAPTSALEQVGNGNAVGLAIFGNANLFGIRQTGDDNIVGDPFGPLGAAALVGNRNMIGIDQGGTGNRLEIIAFDGSDNDVGIAQSGTNLSSISLNGSGNAFGIDQTGTNTATLSIEGSGNGDGLFTGYAAQLQMAATGSGLTPGTIMQNGAGNTVSLTIHGIDGPGSDGDDNIFGIVQDGDLNSVTGTQAGNGNQVAIFQSGDMNGVNFVQTGSFNVLAVSQ